MPPLSKSSSSVTKEGRVVEYNGKYWGSVHAFASGWTTIENARLIEDNEVCKQMFKNPEDLEVSIQNRDEIRKGKFIRIKRIIATTHYYL